MRRYSYSYLNRYRSCPLACFYEYELKLRKRDDGSESHHMAYSKAFHKALEVLYRPATPYYALPQVEATALLHEAQRVFTLEYPIQLAPDDAAKTKENGIAALAQYANRWKAEDVQWEVLECEKMDAQDDGFVVKLDLIVRHRETEQIFGVDHKVTGKYLNYDYWSAYEPNAQVTEYVRFIKERYGYCDGFIVNAIALRFRQRAYKGEPAGFWASFERQMFNRNERQLEHELIDRHYWEQRVEQSKRDGYWGMNTSQCKFCPYQEICKAGWVWPEDEELINIQYRQICGKWSGEPLFQCRLDRDHEGDHAPVEITIDSEFLIEV